jgi:hypothetical protein
LSFDLQPLQEVPSRIWISKQRQHDDPSNWLYGRVPAGEKVLLAEGFDSR